MTLCVRTRGARSALFGALARGRGTGVLDFSVSCVFVGGRRGLTLVRHVSGFSNMRSGLLTSVDCLGNVSNAKVRVRGNGPRDDFRMGIVGISAGFFRFVGVPLLSKRALGTGRSLMMSGA